MEQLKNLGFPTIALILGGIMLFLSITKKIDTKIGKATITTKKQQLQLGIGGILLIVSSFYLTVLFSRFSTVHQQHSVLAETKT